MRRYSVITHSLVFLIAGTLLFSFSFIRNNPFSKVTTIVIDAGHGGKDPGCSGHTSKEKEVTLAVALKLGKLIEEKLKDVKVIFTRKTDVFVELEERAQIANRNNADLFISIHCNAASYMETYTVNGKKKKREVINPKPYGSETYVMGIKNEAGKANVVKRENSAMLLEDNYKETYQGFDPNSDESYIIMSMWTETFVEQSGKFAANIQKEYKAKSGRIDKGVKRESLWVLWRTKMPSVLTEIGYLTNPEEEKFLASDKGQYALAASLFRAFRNYKNDVEGTNLKFNDDVENMEPITNENIAKGDTAYFHEIEEYKDDSDTADNPKEKLKQLYKDASSLFSAGDYDKAEGKYKEIKQLNAEDKTAKEKLAEITKIRTKYKTVIAKADKLFTEKKYSEAKKQYEDAMVIMPKETYAVKKIKECDGAQKGIAVVNKDADYAALIKKGDELKKLGRYDEAVDTYNKAGAIKASEPGLAERIKQCELLKQEEADDKRYKVLIAEADALLNNKKYAESKAKYYDASLLKPGQQYPKDQISKIAHLTVQENELTLKEDKYKSHLLNGESGISSRDFSSARKHFSEASLLFPDRSEPKVKIAHCDSMLKVIEEVKIKVQKYDALIKAGDEQYKNAKWDEAITSYEAALQIRENDDYSSRQIKACKDAKANTTVGNAEKEYADLISAADQQFMDKKFEEALSNYEKASKLKPEEDYPKFQIRLTQKSITWQKQSEEFKAILVPADEAFKLGNYKEAADRYKIAVKYISDAKENQNKFKPAKDELNKRIAELESKILPRPIKDSVNVAIADPVANSAVVIRVQFYQASKLIDTKAAKYKDISEIWYYNHGGMIKYTAGKFLSVADAEAYREKLKAMGYTDAFLVAFKDGQRIDFKTANELLSQKKNP